MIEVKIILYIFVAAFSIEYHSAHIQSRRGNENVDWHEIKSHYNTRLMFVNAVCSQFIESQSKYRPHFPIKMTQGEKRFRKM